MTTSAVRRAVLAGLDQGDGTPVTDRIDRVLNALDRAGFMVITKADALAAARCVNAAGVLGVADAPLDLAQRLEPDL